MRRRVDNSALWQDGGAGGSACGDCGTGQACAIGADCLSQVCTAGVCQAPTCTDLAQASEPSTSSSGTGNTKVYAP